MEQTLNVEGMSCGGCESTIVGGLLGMPGVQEASADHQAKQVVVRFEPQQVGLDAIRERIEEMGFDVLGAA
ncbi:MAG TPA: cation transporter [Actinomycetota bacterium]|nr:cation transporter [Actinomycetota bacterium]